MLVFLYHFDRFIILREVFKIAIKNKSVRTYDNPEFIDIEPFNPNISKCVVKVAYVGENRNGSFLSKETLTEAANSLPSCPIVGLYSEDKEDFRGHGEVLKIDDDGLHFDCETVPYGFISPVDKPWFQTFIDTNEFGEETEREYLMANGYLWTGAYPEVQKVIDEGQPQSMELDGNNTDGHWASNKDGIEFFIIDDTIFNKICILGDDVEPCYEGANITSANFTEDSENSFAFTVHQMMSELNNLLKSEGGNMPEDIDVDETFDEANDNTVTDETAEQVDEEFSETDGSVSTPSEVVDDTDEVVDETFESNENAEDSEVEETQTDNVVFSKEEFAAFQAELDELKAFKQNIERDEKQKVIDKYHFLSDDDKKGVIDNIDNYSLQQIDEKLALIYVNKFVDFSTVDGRPESDNQETNPLLQFKLDDNASENSGDINIDPIEKGLREIADKF